MLRAPAAYAVGCAPVATESDLADLIDEVNFGNCDTIEINGSFQLTADIPAITPPSSITLLTISMPVGGLSVDADSNRGFNVTLDEDQSLRTVWLNVQNAASAGSGGALAVYGPTTGGYAEVYAKYLQVSHSTAAADGGGVFLSGVDFTSVESAIDDSDATGNGGGLFIERGGEIDLSGMELTDCTAVDGAGMHVTAVSLHGAVNVFDGGTATGIGGGAYIKVTSESGFYESHVLGNTAAAGAGMYISGDVHFQEDTAIHGNHAVGRSTGTSIVPRGGGLFLVDGEFSLADLSIFDNYAKGTTAAAGGMSAFGGGVYVASGATLNINGVGVHDNDALKGGTGVSDGGGHGGAVAVGTGGALHVSHATFSGNHADTTGGAVRLGPVGGAAPGADISYSVFTGNTSTDSGAAINTGDSVSSTLQISGSRFEDNDAGNTAAVASNMKAVIEGTTFTGNDAGNAAGAVALGNASSPRSYITNSFISGNTAGLVGGLLAGSDVTVAFSTITENTGMAFDNIALMPSVNAQVYGAVVGTPAGYDDCLLAGATVTDRYAVSVDGTCGFTDSTSHPNADWTSFGFTGVTSYPNAGGIDQDFQTPSTTGLLARSGSTTDLGVLVGGSPITTDQLGTPARRPSYGANTTTPRYSIGSIQVDADFPAPPVPGPSGGGSAAEPTPAPTPTPTPTATPTPMPTPTPPPVTPPRRPRSSTIDVFFPVWSADLTVESRAMLNAFVRRIGTHPTKIVSVGFTQGTGTPPNAAVLSKKRSKSVVRYLRDLGVRTRFIYRGDGNKNNFDAARRVRLTATYVPKDSSTR